MYPDWLKIKECNVVTTLDTSGKENGYLIDILNQNFTVSLKDDNYDKYISSAQTFCLLSELLILYKNNLIKGGSLKNARREAYGTKE